MTSGPPADILLTMPKKLAWLRFLRLDRGAEKAVISRQVEC